MPVESETDECILNDKKTKDHCLILVPVRS